MKEKISGQKCLNYQLTHTRSMAHKHTEYWGCWIQINYEAYQLSENLYMRMKLCKD